MKKQSGQPSVFKVPVDLYFPAVDARMATALGEIYAHKLTEFLTYENSGWIEDKISVLTTNGPPKEVKPEDVPKESYDPQKIIDSVGEEMGRRLLDFRRGANTF
jgi:hypothetical protein